MRTIKADHLNIQRKDLKPLTIGDVVRVQTIQRGQKESREGTVTEDVKNRSYTVEASSGRFYFVIQKYPEMIILIQLCERLSPNPSLLHVQLTLQ